MENTKDIAVIGIGLKFPRADYPKTFWECLRDGMDCVGTLPEGRMQDAEEYVRAIHNDVEVPDYRKAAYLERIDTFDYEFFKISPKEAALMDPHQRLLLETAFHAIENAGYARKIAGTKSGVFIGFPTEFSAIMYQHLIMKLNPEQAENSFSGNLPAVLAGRISYFFNLKGPSLLVDTSCSSSLAAVHMACSSLINGECETALVGGINLFIVPTVNKVVENIGIIAPDGRTKSFDEDCDGVGQGEGVGVMLLKPLSRALEDHDYIHAVIKGSAVNQDGKSIGITAPSAGAQEQVLMQAWENAGVDPVTVSYIETHGTATKLGDPTEILGIRKAFANYTPRRQFCGIGSVKSNIGHTIGAAGVAGMIKAILSLEQRQIPPSLNLMRPNRKIKFEDSPVYLNHRLRPWLVSPRRCGVSSFGISGTNAHVVLEEAPELCRESQAEPGRCIFTLSAIGREQLRELAERTADYLGGDRSDSLIDLCYTSTVGRLHLKYRIALLAEDVGDLRRKLVLLSRNPDTPQASVWTNSGSCTPAPSDLEGRDMVPVMDDAATICESYVRGRDIPWENLYSDTPAYTVPLPHYPFKKNRCWIQTDPRVLAERKPNSAEEMYRTVWNGDPLPSTALAWTRKQVVLFTDHSVASATLAAMLRRQGNRVLEIEIGPVYVPIAEERICVALTESDFERLLPHLQAFVPDKIIHLTTAFGDGDPDTLGQLELNLEAGVYSLLYLVKTLHKLKPAVGMELVIVTAGTARIESSDLVQPHNAALVGLGKTVRWEYPQLKCRSIDVGRGSTVEDLMTEIQCVSGEYTVALRGGRRYVEAVEAVPASSMSTRPGPSLYQGGTYVITGGLGRIGIRLAEMLSGRQNINLVLLGRSEFPPRERWQDLLAGSDERENGLRETLVKLAKIEQGGSSVDVRSCDIGDRHHVEVVFRDIRRDYGSIDGLIHLAVADETCTLTELTSEMLNSSIRAKVHGTWILDRETRGDKLSFFILFSSVMTLVSGLGNGTYTLSNAYLDAYAGYRNSQMPGAMAIDWPEWEDIGLTEDKQTDEGRSIFKKISAQQGIETFSRMLSLNADRLIAGELNVSSQVFKLLDYLPFRLSDELTARIQYYGKANPVSRPLAAAEMSVTPPYEQGTHGREVQSAVGVSQVSVWPGLFSESPAPALAVVPVQTEVLSQPLPIQPGRDTGLEGRLSGEYTSYERILVNAWQDMFGYETINVTDNFFELGGDSIFAFRLAVKLADEGLNVEASDILRYQSIESIADFIGKSVGVGAVTT
ncbi:hypothetical protein BSK48_20135 [Paenibacillus odorifer]|uniref:beta-ketoacyl synthase N-terminal-like domain-containing protein n=1 Tax=Paenibacillus odorifer TaxID=189426 RepID=UPI00096DF2BF|nr:beta-ketoacyl synthase N-terminal-like domain-containing protein [Paenibacillus odorifer]OMD67410.1 hypothetical protein BSK48_20135 [Paenibacillus odorifer]